MLFSQNEISKLPHIPATAFFTSEKFLFQYSAKEHHSHTTTFLSGNISWHNTRFTISLVKFFFFYFFLVLSILSFNRITEYVNIKSIYNFDLLIYFYMITQHEHLLQFQQNKKMLVIPLVFLYLASYVLVK